MTRALVGCLTLVALLAGCAFGRSSTDGRSAETLTSALDEAASAVEVGRLVVELVVAGRTTTPTADITLLDALEDINGAQGTLARDVPDTDHQPVRDRGMSAVADATSALAAARAWVNATSPRSTEQVQQGLDDAADAIEQVTAELGA